MLAARYRFVGLLLILGSTTPLVLAGRTSEAYRATLKQQQAQYEKSTRDLPVVEANSFQDVFHLQVQDGRLTLTSPIKPSSDRLLQRVAAKTSNASAVVVSEQLSRDVPSEVQFTFVSREYPDLDTFRQAQVLWRPQEQELAANSQTLDGVRQVTLSQADDHVQLSGSANAIGEPPESVLLTEKDFATLRRLHPRETERWLRPLFRAIQQVQAFPPDVSIAWQVLGDNVAPSDAVTRALSAELPNLNDDNFRVRRDAARRLEKLGGSVIQAIARLDRHNLSPEQNLRLDEVIASFKVLPDSDARALQHDPQYLLDCLYCEDAKLNELAMRHLETLVGPKPDINLSRPVEKRAADIEAFRGRLSPAVIQPSAQQAPDDPVLLPHEN